MLTRRELLGGAPRPGGTRAGRGARPRSVRRSKFRFGQLQLGTGTSWNPRPTRAASGSRGRSRSARRSTSSSSRAIVTPTSDTLHETPFLYLAGEREFELPSTAGIEALRRFLTFGGFLLDRQRRGLDRRRVRRLGPQADRRGVPAAATKGLEVVPTRSRRLQVVLPARQAARPARDRARDGRRDPRRPARRARTSRTISAARGRATTSATTTSRASPAARSSASSRSAWA